MLNVSLIFPGQGAQKVGMGKEFYEASPEARKIFDEADAFLGNGLTDVIFNGPQEKLTATAYSQPAIFTFSIAALKAFQAHPKYKNISVKFTAGLSLGEYSALAASEALSLRESLDLVRSRSSLMEEATRLAKGSMAAVIGFEKEKLLEICKAVGAEVANFNSPQQIVITGHADKVAKACEAIKTAGAKSVIPLDVSGAFHSSLMQPAADKFKDVLKNVNIRPAKVPVISNVDGKPSSDPEHIRANLARQITSSVQWVDTVNFIVSQGVNTFIEIGPGKVLTGLIKRINSGLTLYNIEKPEDVEKLP